MSLYAPDSMVLAIHCAVARKLIFCCCISKTLCSCVPCLYGHYHPVWLPIVGWTSSVVSIMYRLRLSSQFVWGMWHKPFIMKSIQDSSCSGRCQCCIHDRLESLVYILHWMILVITFTYNVHILHSSV